MCDRFDSWFDSNFTITDHCLTYSRVLFRRVLQLPDLRIETHHAAKSINHDILQLSKSTYCMIYILEHCSPNLNPIRAESYLPNGLILRLYGRVTFHLDHHIFCTRSENYPGFYHFTTVNVFTFSFKSFTALTDISATPIITLSVAKATFLLTPIIFRPPAADGWDFQS